MPPVPRPQVLLHGQQTEGHVSLTEIVVPPRSPGPPLHVHGFDEAFYVLSGELVFEVGGVRTIRGAGEVCFAPRHAPHALANHREEPARYVLVCTPAGFERHWARLAAAAEGVEPPAWALEPVPEVTVVGPPIAGSPGT